MTLELFDNCFSTDLKKTDNYFDCFQQTHQPSFHRDPQIRKDFVNALYDDEGPFLKAIPKALSDDGIFISQVGESTHIDDPAEQYTDDLNRYRLVNSLSRLGFSTIRSYSDNAHSGFYYPWQFVTAFKNPHTKADWFANPSLVDLKIRTRSMITVDGGSPFKFFDGAQMQSYYYPPKPISTVYCRDSPDSRHCKEGHGFDLGRENLPMSTLEVRDSSIGENAGKGVFANVNIPRNSYVGLAEHISAVMHGDAHTYDTFLKTSKLNGGKFWGLALDSFLHGYGEISSHSGRDSFIVDPTVRLKEREEFFRNNTIVRPNSRNIFDSLFYVFFVSSIDCTFDIHYYETDPIFYQSCLRWK